MSGKTAGERVPSARPSRQPYGMIERPFSHFKPYVWNRGEHERRKECAMRLEMVREEAAKRTGWTPEKTLIAGYAACMSYNETVKWRRFT